QNMQSSTGQYSTHAGDPAQPVQHSVITASSLGFFLRGVVMPLERGSCFSASGTIPTGLTASRSAHIAPIILSLVPVLALHLRHLHCQTPYADLLGRCQLRGWSLNPLVGEALVDIILVVELFELRVHELIEHLWRDIKELEHLATRELNLENF